MNTPITLSDGAMRLLVKVAKKTKGIVHIPSVQEIAPLLGWTVTRAFIPRAGYTASVACAMSAAITAAGGRSGYGLDRASWFRAFDHKDVTGYTDEKPGVADAIVSALSGLGTVLPKKATPPATVEFDGVMFLREVVVEKDYGDREMSVTALVWTSMAGYVVRDANDKVLGVMFPAINHFKDGRVEESEEADKPGTVWTWAYKAGLDRLAVDAIAALGDEATRRRRPEHPAGDEHTGHCQICRRSQKMKGWEGTSPTLVDHGYHHEHTGQGIGYSWGSHGYLGARIGSCYGVGFMPWEIDSTRLRWYRDAVVEPAVKRLADHLWALRVGTVVSIEVDVPVGHRGDREIVVYTPTSTEWPHRLGIRSWADLVEREIAQTQHEHKVSSGHLARINRDLDGWKRAPLYDELHPATA